MACPICDHTMQSITMGWFWCPRCGTVRHSRLPAESPMLVERVHKLIEMMKDPGVTAGIDECCRVTGVTESINKEST